METPTIYQSEWDENKKGTFSYVVYARPEDSGPLPSTVPTDDGMLQYGYYEHLDIALFFQPDSGAAPANVGSLQASLLRRDRVTGRFGESMSSFVSDETNVGPVSEFEGMTLDLELDDYARLPRGMLDKLRTQGLGVWGADLNRGNLVVVESVFVNPSFWRGGLGRKMVRVLIDVVRKKGSEYTILARPVFLINKTVNALQADMGDDRLTEEQVRGIETAGERQPRDFWYAQGLRRVGTMAWLGLSSDPGHPATGIAKDQDAELDFEAYYAR